MFNLFQSKEEKKEEIEYASVKFYITEPGEPPKVSVNIEDYGEESINSLCCIVSLLGEDFVTVETISVIKNFLLQTDQEKTFISIAQKLGEMEAFKMQLKQNKSHIKQKLEPCIKPSELS